MKIEEEFDAFDKSGSWTSLYHKIRQDSVLQHDFSVKDSKRPEFKGRNRYRDVSPYDHSRVVLEKDDIDYINASLIQYPDARRSYILTQGPLPNTAGHFWLMVWEHNSRAILMLNRIIEKGQIKCHQYFPIGAINEDEDQLVFEDVGLKVSYTGEENSNIFVVRTLELEDIETGEKKQVLQFHYTTWPDFGVPESPEAFLNFLFAVREAGVLEDSVGPPVIHCSAGIGRSGTFCLVDTCLVIMENSTDPDSVNVCDILMEMRRYRMGLIQTADQLRFSYMAIIEGCKQLFPPSEDVNENHQHKNPSPDNNNLPSENQQSKEDEDSCESPSSTPPPIPPRTSPPDTHSGMDIAREVPSQKPTEPVQINHPDAGRGPSGDVDEDLSSLDTSRPSAASLRNGRPDSAINANEEGEEEFMDMTSAHDGSTSQQSHEIRRRNREERKKKTADQIATMKQKQRECEKWKIQQRTMRPYFWGLSAAVLLGSYLFYRCYFIV